MSAATAIAAAKVQDAVSQGQKEATAEANKTSPNKKPIKELPASVQKLETTSSKIRELNSRKWATGDIARSLGIRYQHVYNVINQPLKRKSA